MCVTCHWTSHGGMRFVTGSRVMGQVERLCFVATESVKLYSFQV